SRSMAWKSEMGCTQSAVSVPIWSQYSLIQPTERWGPERMSRRGLIPCNFELGQTYQVDPRLSRLLYASFKPSNSINERGGNACHQTNSSWCKRSSGSSRFANVGNTFDILDPGWHQLGRHPIDECVRR